MLTCKLNIAELAVTSYGVSVRYIIPVCTNAIRQGTTGAIRDAEGREFLGPRIFCWARATHVVWAAV
jgi:hypothetical protein